jgi:hypothetical protein
VSPDIPGDVQPPEPGLSVLFGMLTAGPTQEELAGEDAAVRMFLASAAQQDTAELEPVPELSAPRMRASGRRAWRVPLLTGAAAALAAGFTLAAYSGALPAPLQDAAYHVLGFAGVPRAGRVTPTGSHSGGLAQAHGAAPPPGGTGSPGAPASPPTGSSPAAPPATGLFVVAQGRIPAGAGDMFVGRLTDHGSPVGGAAVTLLERPAGQSGWQVAGAATTGGDGVAAVSVSDLTTNAVFELTGPGGAQSQQVLVVVVPPVSASIAGGPRGQPDTLTASSPLADPGDAVVLESQTASGWVAVQTGKLDGSGQAVFLVRLAAGHQYRVVLLPTTVHGLSVSNTAGVPQR